MRRSCDLCCAHNFDQTAGQERNYPLCSKNLCECVGLLCALSLKMKLNVFVCDGKYFGRANIIEILQIFQWIPPDWVPGRLSRGLVRTQQHLHKRAETDERELPLLSVRSLARVAFHSRVATHLREPI